VNLKKTASISVYGFFASGLIVIGGVRLFAWLLGFELTPGWREGLLVVATFVAIVTAILAVSFE